MSSSWLHTDLLHALHTRIENGICDQNVPVARPAQDLEKDHC
jgi:hypothetical protein